MAKEATTPKPAVKPTHKTPARAPVKTEAAAARPVSDGREVAHAVPRLKKIFLEQVVAVLMEKHGYKNPFEVPRIKKVVINIGVSDARDNIQMLDVAREELALIAGQWPEVRRAKMSISNFKLRQGMPIGLRVTLRADRMYEFLDRLITTAIPRIRDFRGLEPKAFDGSGNYNLGLREQLIFAEIGTEKATVQRGMNITIVTTTSQDEESRTLLQALGMPFKATVKG
jgi:large subunit ribosomal protein L5